MIAKGGSLVNYFFEFGKILFAPVHNKRHPGIISLGVKIDLLTEEQEKYLNSWEIGT